MGYMGALSMAEENGINEHTMLWHLQCNHIPAIPAYMVPLALRAVEYGNKGDFEHKLRVPKETRYRGKKTCTVMQAIEALDLDAFITWDVL